MRELREVMRLYREVGQPVRDFVRRVGVARAFAAGAFGGWSALNLMRNTYTHAEDTETKINEALSRGLLKAEIKTKLKLSKEP